MQRFTQNIYELSSPGRGGAKLPGADVPARDYAAEIPASALRQEPAALPEVAEPEIMRHYVAISSLNHHVDKAIYPLGSCTMKYNPKINERTARIPGFAFAHPNDPIEAVQGSLQLMYELQNDLIEITGMDDITLQPLAGAQGEYTGLLLIAAYFEGRKEKREIILIPDSAHGTNPASAAMCGFRTVKVKTNGAGEVDIDDLRDRLDENVAAVMITNPNTLGIFESQAAEIDRLVHANGSLIYMDGANLNALFGIARPGDMGFDVMHMNLHKSFSTPHGGGGPGSGPVACKSILSPFLPTPKVVKNAAGYAFSTPSQSIGKLHAFYGNFGMFVRAYTYCRLHGGTGFRRIAENAIINANYLKQGLKETFPLGYENYTMHEFVLSGAELRQYGVKTLDVAKRLLDFGMHAPTVYFPLNVREAMMIEPTESETKDSLDLFITVMKQIAKEAEENPEIVKTAPHSTPVGRLDEVKANRVLNLQYSEKTVENMP
jgi:glycine dehydrogenase subunit 2